MKKNPIPCLFRGIAMAGILIVLSLGLVYAYRSLVKVEPPEGKLISHTDNRIYSINTDGSMETTLYRPSVVDKIVSVSLSPDNSMIAVNTIISVFVMNVDGSGVVDYSDHISYDLSNQRAKRDIIQWSNNSAYLMFLWDREFLILSVKEGTANVFDLVDEYQAYPAWAPRESSITFENDSELFTARRTGTGTSHLYSVEGKDGIESIDWSPNRTKIAMITGLGTLEIINRNGDFLFSYDDLKIDTSVAPVWSPNSQNIVVSLEEENQKNVFAIINQQSGSIVIFNVVEDMELTWEANFHTSNYQWSPDGKWLMFSISGLNYDESSNWYRTGFIELASRNIVFLKDIDNAIWIP